MKLSWQLITLLSLLFLTLCTAGEEVRNERWHAERIAKELGGKTEVKVANGRVDIVTETHAIEVEWAKNWKESIGQALWYAFQTGKKPGIYLIGEKEEVAKAAVMLRSVLKANGLDILVSEEGL